ncbi:uncharacterized protein J3D65DRAFT_676978 [Phyllosticta citribraziliensis]|uniref:BTB domain-containing protein n=1 Tax=Phyllosticta citribraziliensis TaxID=989973 RepID=A0ABR1LP30_9PEZI
MSQGFCFTPFWRSGKFSDVEVRLREKIFKSYKIVLRTQSRMFGFMISMNPTTEKINLKLADAEIFPDSEIFEVFLEAIHTGGFNHDRNYPPIGNIAFALKAYKAGQRSGTRLLTSAAASNFRLLLSASQPSDFRGHHEGDDFERLVRMMYAKSSSKSVNITKDHDEDELRGFFMTRFAPGIGAYLRREQIETLVRCVPEFAGTLTMLSLAVRYFG